MSERFSNCFIANPRILYRFESASRHAKPSPFVASECLENGEEKEGAAIGEGMRERTNLEEFLKIEIYVVGR